MSWWDNLREALFGPIITPEMVLADSVAKLKQVHREHKREAFKATREEQALRVQIDNLRDSGEEFVRYEAQLLQLLKLEEEEHRKASMYLAQATSVNRVLTQIDMQAKGVRTLHAQLTAAKAIIRFGSRLPQGSQVMGMVMAFQRATETQSMLRDDMGDAIADGADGLLDDDEDADLLSADSVKDTAQRKLAQMRLEAGISETADLDALPDVLGRPHKVAAASATQSDGKK